jgi:type IV pilus assembly protein PilW
MNKQKGFSLVELMISVLMGLLAVIAATTAMRSFEGSKRGSVSASDSMQNGFLALFAIEADGEKAGWGLNDSWLLGCPTLMYDAKLPSGSGGYPLGAAGGTTNQTLAPVLITASGTNQPDQISFYRGSSPTGTGALTVSPTTYVGDNTAITISDARMVLWPGDVYVVAADPTTRGATPCLIGQVSSDIVTAFNTLGHTTGTISGTNFNVRFNNAAGLTSGQTYLTGSARVYNLGPGEPGMNRGAPPVFRSWFVQNGNLMIRSSDVLTNDQVADTVAVSNIVNLKAQYGFQVGGVTNWSNTLIDANADGVIDFLDWQAITAIRVAVVARSREVEKPGDDGTCTNMPAVPCAVFPASNVTATCGASATPISVVVTGDSVNSSCYRYKVFESVIPMRNLAWRPS